MQPLFPAICDDKLDGKSGVCHFLCQCCPKRARARVCKAARVNFVPFYRHGSSSISEVFDDRKRRIRGLWKRNDHFYARLVILAESRTALQDLQKDRREENLPVLKQSPKLMAYWEDYFKFYDSAKDPKRHGTLRLEKTTRRSWLEYLPDLRLKDISRKHINGFIADRQEKGLAARSVNLYVIALRNVLKRAKEEKLIKVLPTENLRPLKVNQRKRRLYIPEEMEKLYTAATALPRSGQMLADILRLMTTCGSRISETLLLKWSDVDFKHQQITIGSGGLAKNRKPRVVDFNVALVNQSTLIKDLVQRGKLDVKVIKGKWESFLVTAVADPLPGVARALVIAGSDRRGTAYGIFEVSKAIGVSPWVWWAVPGCHCNPESRPVAG